MNHSNVQRLAGGAEAPRGQAGGVCQEESQARPAGAGAGHLQTGLSQKHLFPTPREPLQVSDWGVTWNKAAWQRQEDPEGQGEHGRWTHLGPPWVSGRPTAQHLPVPGGKRVDGLRSPEPFRGGFTQAISAAARHHPTEEPPDPQWPLVPTPSTAGQRGVQAQDEDTDRAVQEMPGRVSDPGLPKDGRGVWSDESSGARSTFSGRNYIYSSPG